MAKKSLSQWIPAELWDALDRASPKHGDKTRIVREALEAHPEVRRELDKRKDD